MSSTVNDGVKSPLFLKLNRVLAAVNNLTKDQKNQHFGYRFVSSDKVLTELRSTLALHGLAFSTQVVSRELIVGTTSKGKSWTRWVIEYEFAFHDPESGESLSRRWYGEADADDDKGINKANTAAEKYFLLKMFLISTGDDPDADADGERPDQRRPRRKPDADADGDDLAWFERPGALEAVYAKFVANQYATDNQDAIGLLKRAGVTREVLAGFETVDVAAPALRKMVDAFLVSAGPAKPAAADALSRFDDPALPDATAPRSSIADVMQQRAIEYLGDGDAASGILATMGVASWDALDNVTKATEALQLAIVKHRLPFVCRQVKRVALGKGASTHFVMPGAKAVAIMNGGRTEIKEMMGEWAFNQWSVAAGTETWVQFAIYSLADAPVLVEWEPQDGKGNRVKALTPLLQDDVLGAAA